MNDEKMLSQLEAG